MSKSLQEKELETLILQFFNQNRAVNFATIANKIGLRRSAKSEKEIPVKSMFPIIQQIAKYGFSIGDYGFWIEEIDKDIIWIYAVDLSDSIKTESLKFIKIESIEDIFKIMNNEK
jgi:hypothetical protein